MGEMEEIECICIPFPFLVNKLNKSRSPEDKYTTYYFKTELPLFVCLYSPDAINEESILAILRQWRGKKSTTA